MRLTKKVENEEKYIANNFKREKGERLFAAIDNYNAKVYNKLGQLEDLMEKFDIESIEELEEIVQDGMCVCFDVSST